MKISLKKQAFAVLAASALVLTGCSSSDSNGQGADIGEMKAGDYNPQDRDNIQDGGELTLAISELPEQMLPFHANAILTSTDLWRWSNPVLALYDAEGEYTPNPDYIEDVEEEVVDGKTVVTYTIGEEANYNDGTPIDWRAFENTWKKNNGSDPDYTVNTTDGYKLVESVTAGDNDKQAVITFDREYAWWQSIFNTLVPPQVETLEQFNEAYLKNVNNDWAAGPFIVENADFNRGEFTLVKNDKWWGDEAKLDKISFRAMEDQASLNAFRAGEIDATGVANRERYNTAQEMGDQAEIRTATSTANRLITLNSDAPVLGDDQVREAIFDAIDRAQLADIRFNGLDYSEPLPGSFVNYSFQDGYEDNVEGIVDFDPEKANRLLDEAGWEQDGQFRTKDGETLALRYVMFGDDPLIKALAAAMQSMLADVGIQLNVEEKASSDFSNVMSERDFDMIFSGYASIDPYGVAGFAQIYASDSTLNKSGTGTPEIDEKIAELEAIGDPDEAIKRANEIEKDAMRNYGILPILNGPNIIAVKPGLANFGPKGFAVVQPQNVGWEK